VRRRLNDVEEFRTLKTGKEGRKEGRKEENVVQKSSLFILKREPRERLFGAWIHDVE
jgi:hypothetical protein